jgi:hypothetical protein
MSSKFDIFRKTPETPLTWVERVEDIHEAKKRLIGLASSNPGDYLIWDFSERKFVEPFGESA